MNTLPQYEQLTNKNIREALRVWKLVNPTRSKKYDIMMQRFGHISDWDTSQITNMRQLLSGAKIFNQDISRWDTSKVDTMCYMFNNAHAFNGDISRWNTSRVATMERMFDNAHAFNGDISNWDTSRVHTTSGMFVNARSFNQDISRWNLYRAEFRQHMFLGASLFNQNLSGWYSRWGNYENLMFKSSGISNSWYFPQIGGRGFGPRVFDFFKGVPFSWNRRRPYLMFLHATRTNCIPDEMLREIGLYI